MFYTLGQVKKALAGNATGAYQSKNLTDDINRAVQGLSNLSGWQCLRRTVRLISAGPVFALPQGYAGLVRVCINGTPASLRSQDFRFLHSGPGDLRRPPVGFTAVDTRNVLDVGLAPVIYEPTHPFYLVAVVADSSTAPSQKLSVVGTRRDGCITRADIPIQAGIVTDSSGETLTGVEAVMNSVVDSPIFLHLDEVVLGDGLEDYVSLYAVNAQNPADCYQIACYNPKIPVPKFRKYEITQTGCCTPNIILAETRIDPAPLVKDTDVIPFESPIEPIEWMIRADWQMKSGEVQQAQNYRAQAMNWLKSHEVVDETKQTQVVINSVYKGSMGELSDEAENI